MTYQVFTRTWWKRNPRYPNGLEPSMGRKYTIGQVATEEEAREMCKEYNTAHEAGELSRKAEYQEI